MKGRIIMNTELDNRNMLIKLIECMSHTDIQQMLAYAAGYEAGKISRVSLETSNPLYNITRTN